MSTNTLFLEEVASHILNRHSEELDKICIVSPNRRAGIFLRAHLAALNDKVRWAPDILPVEDFINRISGLSILDKNELLFRFFNVFAEETQANEKGFDDFIRWAPVLLKDFEEMDSALDDPLQLMAFLQDAKRLESWNPDGSPPTESQKNYLVFFSHIPVWYKKLSESLLDEGLAWQGLSSRIAAVRLKEHPSKLAWSHVILVGFNALSRAEETLINLIADQGKASFLVDADKWYVKNTHHEAGTFIRRHARKWQAEKDDFPENLGCIAKTIRIIGVPRPVNQARLAGNILRELPESQVGRQTALVLADEKLLIPVLNSLPHQASGVNVTMGYPLNRSHMYGFFEILMRMQLNQAIPDQGKPQEQARYHKSDWLSLFSHSLSSLLLEDSGTGEGKKGTVINTANHQADDLRIDLARRLRRSARRFFSLNDIGDLAVENKTITKNFDFLKQSWSTLGDMGLTVLLSLCSHFDTAFRLKAAHSGKDILQTSYFVDFESLYYLARLIRRLQAFLKRFPFLASFDHVYRLFRQTASETRLSFSGEPLEGLQVMGMLETRSLDFDHVILLSANEGILPSQSGAQSFIPHDVRRKFGLSVQNDRDATHAYHFYRLLQRATKIDILYDTQTDGLGSGEKSRFITQIENELVRDFPDNISISNHFESLTPRAPAAAFPEAILRNSDVEKKISCMASEGFSPSSLALWINCPLSFYLNRIAGIKESDETDETLDASTLGTVQHDVLEQLFRPFIQQQVPAAEIRKMRLHLASFIENAFSRHYPEGEISTGRNRLLAELITRYLGNFLEAEEKRISEAPCQIISLEQELSHSISLNNQSVRIRGKADRIDRCLGMLRLVDYKSGRVEPRELQLTSWEELIIEPKHTKAFQLLCYAWMYHRMNPGETALQAGIFSLRQNSQSLILLQSPEKTDVLRQSDFYAFEEQLKQLIGRITDKTQPIRPTDEPARCRYCRFRKMCRR